MVVVVMAVMVVGGGGLRAVACGLWTVVVVVVLVILNMLILLCDPLFEPPRAAISQKILCSTPNGHKKTTSETGSKTASSAQILQQLIRLGR